MYLNIFSTFSDFFLNNKIKMTDSTNSEPEIPSEISEAANAATNQILPPKSKQLYDSTTVY